MFSQLFAAAFLAVTAQSALAADCSRSYKIQAGDYCDKISASQNVSTFQLAAVNSGSINSGCTNLQIGSDLCLGHTGEDCSTTYVVKAGDTCTAIASGSGTNTTILILNNPQIDSGCNNIYVGEVLCISKGVQVPPIPAGGVVVPVSGPPANPPPVADGKPAPPPPTAITVTPPPSAGPTGAAPAPDNSADDDCDDDSTDDSNTGDNNTGDNAGDDDDDADLPFCDEL